ncbi:hypothetical protein [Halorubrum ezzemoulense]|uniref:hypothetical protein n=1 Tax=Halorubrum ezzemoulense TaxID=337243 RepID=UPI0026C42066|nr:hypothetical protein [Halorubrum ezzemoulense]
MTEVRDTAVVERVRLVVDERERVVGGDGGESLVKPVVAGALRAGELLDVVSVRVWVAGRRQPLVATGSHFWSPPVGRHCTCEFVRGYSKTPIESRLIRVNEGRVAVEALLDGQVAQIGEPDGVVLAATVDSRKAARFEVEDVPADGAVSDIDRVVVSEVAIGSTVGALEIAEEASFSRLAIEITDRLPNRIDRGLGGSTLRGTPTL